MDDKSAYLQKPWLRKYPDGIAAQMNFPERSVAEAFDEATEKWGKKTALIFYGTWVSFSELRAQVDRFANALHHLGVKKGDRVAIHLLNSPQFIIAYFGVIKIGAVVTPISPVYVSSEVRHQVEDSGAETLICQDVLYHVIEETKLQRFTRLRRRQRRPGLGARTVLPQTSSEAILKPQTAGQILVAAKGLS